MVIPCLNEAAMLGVCIDKARRCLEALGLRAEIVVADNGSIDGSPALAEEHGARVVIAPERGYGNALAAGIASARGRFVIMGDGDNSYDFSALGPFVDGLRSGADLVVGNRFAGSIEPGAMPLLHRYLGNPTLSFVGRRLFGTPCRDIYCGLRAFDREKIQALDLQAGGMEFAIEMVVKATLAGLRITEVPTTLSPDAEDRTPHLKTWRDGWRSLRLLLLYSPSWLFLYPGLALMAAGLAGMAWLLPGQRTVGGVTFDVSTLLYAALAIVIGLQAVILYLTARQFGVAEGLLPDRRLDRFLRGVTLEVGLLAAFVLVAAGLGLSVYALQRWNATGFGRLDYPSILRVVIPGSTLITCGCQIGLSALFLSVLGLNRR